MLALRQLLQIVALGGDPYDLPCPKGGCASVNGRTCPAPYNQCPALGGGGTSIGSTGAPTCDPGTAGCKQGFQCQAREANPFMPLFHILGNFTDGDGTQPIAINDISGIIRWKGVLHVFHQFGQWWVGHAANSPRNALVFHRTSTEIPEKITRKSQRSPPMLVL